MMALELRLRPHVEFIKLERSCPDGSLKIQAQVSLRTVGGLKVAEHSVDQGYGNDDLKVEWTAETIESGRTFLQQALVDIEAGLRKKVNTNVAEPDTL